MMLYSKSTGGFYDDRIHTEAQIPDDAAELADEDYHALFEKQAQGHQIFAGKHGPEAKAPAAPSRDALLKNAAAFVRGQMNATVQERGYDSIESACSYATSTVDAWQAEALACAAWRDAVWQWFYGATSGSKSVPTNEALAAGVAAIQWP